MSESPDGVKVDTEDETSYFVVDPDDYQRTQKLKAIEEAKQEYRDYKRSRAEKISELDEKWSNPQVAYKEELAMRLAGYGDELIPLIEEGLRKSALEKEEDMCCTLGDEMININVRNVVRNNGKVEINSELKPLPMVNCNEVYRQLQRIERKLGLGVELELEKGPAEI